MKGACALVKTHVHNAHAYLQVHAQVLAYWRAIQGVQCNSRVNVQAGGRGLRGPCECVQVKKQVHMRICRRACASVHLVQ